MSTPPNFLDLPWRWRMSAGSLKLAIDNRDGFIILRAPPGGALLTRANDGGYRNLDANDDIAKIIAAAPDVRRHAQALMTGLHLGCIRIDPDDGSDRSTLNNILKNLREALARSGAA